MVCYEKRINRGMNNMHHSLTSHLSIASWNVNGLKSKYIDKGKDRDMIREIQRHDIVCLMETHTGPEYALEIDDYDTKTIKTRPVCKKNNKFYGGLILCVRKTLITGIRVIESPSTEYIWLKLDKVHFNLEKDLYVGFHYVLPRNSTHISAREQDPMEELDILVCKFRTEGHVLVMGDLNSRTASRPDFLVNDEEIVNIEYNIYEVDQTVNMRCSNDNATNTQGLRLLEICCGNQMRILNGRTLGDMEGKFTCHRPGGSSVVDYGIVCEGLKEQVQFFMVHDYQGHLSDHCKISCQIRCHGSTSQLNPEKMVKHHQSIGHKYVWKEDDTTKFLEALHSQDIREKLSSLNNIQEGSFDCNTIIENLNKIIHEVADNSIRKVNVNKKKKKKRMSYKKWFDHDCESYRKSLKKLGSRLQRSPGEHYTRVAFYREKKAYKKLLKFKRREYRQNLISQLEVLSEKSPKTYWKLLSELKNEGQNCKQNTSPITLEEWKQYFEKLHSSDHQQDTVGNPVQNDNTDCYFSELDFRISEEEVLKALHSLKNKKAAGIDGIVGEMLKAGSEIWAPQLTKIFNIIFRSRTYPKEWNKGTITPIYKNGAKHDPNNYRGITVNSVLSKVYSTVLRNRLEKFVEDKSIINDTQIGFKKKAQTSDHLLVIQALTEKYGDGKGLHMCFIDFEKAYDSVWRDALLFKLYNMNVRGLFYDQIKAMHNNVLVCVKEKDNLSEFFTSEKGVKQGEVLSPLLFNLFINDINDCFQKDCEPVSIGSRSLSCIQYADDLVILSQSKDGLQKCLDNLDEYCMKWKLRINTTKSKHMVISKKRIKKKYEIRMGDKPLEWVNTYNYLGMTVSSNGSFMPCKEMLKAKGQKAMYKLKSIIMGTNITKSLSLKMFDQLVFPILSYGSEIWAVQDFNKIIRDHTIQLEDIYPKLPQEKLNIHFCKAILGVSAKATNMAAMAELGRYPLYIRMITHMLKYYRRVKDMDPMSLVAQAVSEMENQERLGKTSWITVIKSIADKLNIKVEQIGYHLKNPGKKVASIIKNKLELRYRQYWKQNLLNQSGKLDTYKKIKDEFKYEEYLDHIIKPDEQISLTRLRISNHKLHIEIGRYKRPYLPREERICELCAGEVEDEAHFLFNCSVLTNIREEYLGENTLIGETTQLLRKYLSTNDGGNVHSKRHENER
jgi:exonuclease III